MSGPEPIDPGQRRLAERRLLAALRRLHREQPLASGVRTDALLARLRRAAPDRRPAGHRGAERLALDDQELRGVLDELVTNGQVEREGRRLRLAKRRPALRGVMQERVATLMAGLRAAGASPPRVAGPAARLGIPPPLVEQLRRAGELIPLGEGIDYPPDVLGQLLGRLDRLAERGPLTPGRVAAQLRTSRRYAEALVRYRARRRGPRGSGSAIG